MARKDTGSPLDRRLRELEEEERVLQQRLKEAGRKARRMEGLTGEPGLSRSEPRLASSVPRPGAITEPSEPAPEEPAATTPLAAARLTHRPGAAARPPSRPETERFASYFANGSFGRARPLGRERRVMRNKAIFMLLVAALAAFVLYRLIF